jgi:CheY-like chemotaxis protein
MRKLRVNIFDDDVINLKMLKACLSPRNYEVLTFDRPVVCPVNYEQQDECIKPCADILITDYQMPQMTGVEMLLGQAQRGCRIDKRNKALMSAYTQSIKQEIIEELGCSLFSKPFKTKEFFGWMDDCEKRVDLSKPVGIIRKDNRYPANLDILYTYNNKDKVYRGTVLNYSDSGLCIQAYDPFTEGQSIVINNDLPNGCRNASVCWVKPVDSGSFYIAGLVAK